MTYSLLVYETYLSPQLNTPTALSTHCSLITQSYIQRRLMGILYHCAVTGGMSLSVKLGCQLNIQGLDLYADRWQTSG